MNRRSLAVVALAAVVVSCAPSNHVTAQLLDAGIVVPLGPQRRVLDPTSATGFRYHGDAGFKSHTIVAPAIQGVAFGISFRIDGVPRFPATRITQVIKHPPMKKPDGTVIHEQISYQDVSGSHGHVFGKLFYTLREDYEVVPGVWSISLMKGSTLLVEQKFFVKPAASRGLG